MPKRKRSSSKYRRKPYTKKRRMSNIRRRPASSNISIARNIVPASKLVRLKYTEFISLNPPSGSGLVRHIFRANSCYDPNQTGTGHQPLGFDQWAIFYDHYTVVGSQCKAQFMSQGSSGSIDSCVVGIHLADSSAPLPTTETLLEQPKSKHRMLTNANATQGVTVTKNFSAKKFFGLQSIKDNRGLVGASINANPTEDAYYSVYAAAYDSNLILNPNEIKVVVTVDYLVYFTERKTLTGS